MKAWGIFALKSLIACGLLLWIWQQGILDPKLLWHGMVHVETWSVGIAINLLIISLGAVRWHLLLRGQGCRLGFSWLHKLTYATTFFNSVVPGVVGGDVLRIVYLLRHLPPEQQMVAGLTVLFDRLLGLYSMFVLAFLAALFLQEALLVSRSGTVLFYLLLAILLLVPLLAVLLLCLFSRISALGWLPQLAQRAWLRYLPVHKLLAAIELLRSQWRQTLFSFFQAVLLSLFCQLLAVWVLIRVSATLDLGSTALQNYLLAAPIAWIANMLPLSPGGLGIGEIAFAQVCQWLQPEAVVALLVTAFLLARLLQILASLPGIIAYFLLDNPQKAPA
ncbi:lysylphosphatidylglycerol synthase transmembrane domain-containing protein [Candidatus Magnetaquicoccus inordinatus]|uniref:lysylphosphatidylglycerol synthase transmembrane domain-containing protein n=1 Tax=Candidatus Magnetaquicoccus inordinatus TaxID=2496818 RepID=UPI00102CCBA6|nr:flippase-like domain-containing protein [Candidatus Magnetaquicoccus inordinatus]